jgi:hypothetical protein
MNSVGSPIPTPTPRASLLEALYDEADEGAVELEFPAGFGPSEPKTDVAREGKDW